MSLTCTAQLPKFPFDGAVWYVLHQDYNATANTVYKTGPDSLINGITWTAIITDFYDISITDTGNIEIFIRPDTSNRVWFRYSSLVSADTTEHILYDYSLQLGDTFLRYIIFKQSPDTFVTNYIATATMANGAIAKIIGFQPATPCLGYSWYEYAGFNGTPFYPLLGLPTAPDTCVPVIICETINDTFIFGNPSMCMANLAIAEVPGNLCKPKKTAQLLNGITYDLSCFHGENVLIRVYDLTGRLVQMETTSSSSVSLVMDMSLSHIINFQADNQTYSEIIAPH